MTALLRRLTIVADHKSHDSQISPTMPPPPMTGSTINPSFVQNPQMKYEAQSYFKGDPDRALNAFSAN
jgi:hypothetical protein